jgi:hypothetical protein
MFSWFPRFSRVLQGKTRKPLQQKRWKVHKIWRPFLHELSEISNAGSLSLTLVANLRICPDVLHSQIALLLPQLLRSLASPVNNMHVCTSCSCSSSPEPSTRILMGFRLTHWLESNTKSHKRCWAVKRGSRIYVYASTMGWVKYEQWSRVGGIKITMW